MADEVVKRVRTRHFSNAKQQGIKSGLAGTEKPDEAPPPRPVATRPRRRNLRR